MSVSRLVNGKNCKDKVERSYFISKVIIIFTHDDDDDDDHDEFLIFDQFTFVKTAIFYRKNGLKE